MIASINHSTANTRAARLGFTRNGDFTLGLGDAPVIAAGDRPLVAEAPRRA